MLNPSIPFDLFSIFQKSLSAQSVNYYFQSALSGILFSAYQINLVHLVHNEVSTEVDLAEILLPALMIQPGMYKYIYFRPFDRTTQHENSMRIKKMSDLTT